MEARLEIVRAVQSTSSMGRRMAACEPMNYPGNGCSEIKSSSVCHTEVGGDLNANKQS